MINTAWTGVLRSLCPEYDILKDMLDRGPQIYADLSQRGKKWCITLQEQVTGYDGTPLWNNPGALDERVDWAVTQLSDWPKVRRMSYDMWYFNRRHDAEKFQTLYNLKWSAE